MEDRTGTAATGATEGQAITHEYLLSIVPVRGGDYFPYGTVPRRDEAYCDCSCGCVFAAWLAAPFDTDWCVCVNPGSHRCGLLTFEHQGCMQFIAQKGG